MRIVHAEELGKPDFNAISDGQRRESFLQELSARNRRSSCWMSLPLFWISVISWNCYPFSALWQKKGHTVIMSLHEIDPNQKIADQILCVKGDHVCYDGTPEQIFEEQTIRELYGIENGFYDPRFGVLSPKVEGEPEVFVIAGCGRGDPHLQEAAKGQYPFCNRYPIPTMWTISWLACCHRGDYRGTFTGSPGASAESTAGYASDLCRCAIGECNKRIWRNSIQPQKEIGTVKKINSYR